MSMLTVRNLPGALRLRAAQHGHSTAAGAREILARTLNKPDGPAPTGEALAALGRQIGLTDGDFELFEQLRNKTPAEPLCFEE